jgi:rhodanese-related sulfurtransferase
MGWLWRRDEPRVPGIDAAELERELASGRRPVLVDVRSAEQFAEGHLPGALHLPLESLMASAASLDRSAPTVVY